MPRLNPRFRRIALRKVGAYYVGELGGGLGKDIDSDLSETTKLV